MMITFADVAAKLIPAAHELLENNMREFVDQNRYNWFHKIMRVDQTTKWVNEMVSMTSTRMWPAYSEGNPLQFTAWDETDKTQFTLTEYQDGFIVAREYLMYGDAETVVIEVFPRLKQKMRQFMERGLLRHSQLASTIWLHAFDTTIHSDMNGLPLCSNVHDLPDGTHFDNKTGLPLSAAALDFAFEGMAEITDQHGVPLDINYDTLLIPPKLKRTAYELISNTVKPGASNDEKNYWAGMIDNVVVCPWLIEKVQAGSSDYWFLIDSKVNTLQGYVGEYPTILPEAKIDPMQMMVVGVTNGVYGWHDWRGVFGSDGGS